MSGPALLFRDADVPGHGRVDVLIRHGRVTEIGSPTAHDVAEVVDAAGGALLPGLHDHHCHLLAVAATEHSVDVGNADLGAALRAATPRAGWVRAVGYAEAAPALDRNALDLIRDDVPIRVQHSGGSLWIVNSAAAQLLELDSGTSLPDGVERDATGRATGRLWRLDGWLRHRLGSPAPDLTALSQRLASYGITGVTDATPNVDIEALRLHRLLRQRVVSLGDRGGDAPWKIVVPDHDLPELDSLVESIHAVRPRPVALHCVTRAALVLVIAALEQGGAVPGDRLEHAAVVPLECVPTLRRLGVAVVTQPSFVTRRGDGYLREVEVEDLPRLWPYASLLAGGIPVACSSDAPYGDLDPWVSIRSAVDRRAPSGRRVAAHEAVSAAQALAGFLSPPDRPGSTSRAVGIGAPADLILLDEPLDVALADPRREHVRTTVIAGEIVYRSGETVRSGRCSE